MWYGSANYVH